MRYDYGYRRFADNFREAFSASAELPVAFRYSDTPSGELRSTQGCMFKAFGAIRAGETVCMDGDAIGCRGGRFYCGFAPMGEHIPDFVSRKERYKASPESVVRCVDGMDVRRTDKRYLCFARADRLDSFDGVEGLIFFARPDVLSGLCSWVFFDNDSPDAVVTLFGSGCGATITAAAGENRRGGRRTFLGLFDPSVRPYFESDVLGLAVPMSRFAEMYATMRECCLFGTHAWSKVRGRISAADDGGAR